MEEEVVEQSNDIQSQDSTDLGTFKNVQALKDAYDNLHSEFTRKSQLLANYQKEEVGDKLLNNSPPNKIQNEKQKDNTDSDIGTLQKFWEKDDWKNQITDFFKEFTLNNDERKQLAQILTQDKDLEYSKSPLFIAYAKMLKHNQDKASQNIQDETYLENLVMNNSQLKEKIINNYLYQLNKDRIDTPQVIAKSSDLMFGGNYNKHPMTLTDANILAKKYFE